MSTTQTETVTRPDRREYYRNYDRTRRAHNRFQASAEYHRQYRSRILLEGRFRCECCCRNMTTRRSLQDHMTTNLHRRMAALAEERRQQQAQEQAGSEPVATAE